MLSQEVLRMRIYPPSKLIKDADIYHRQGFSVITSYKRDCCQQMACDTFLHCTKLGDTAWSMPWIFNWENVILQGQNCKGRPIQPFYFL